MDLALPLCVGHLRTFVPHPEKAGLKEGLIRGLWLTQTGVRVGYGMQGQSAVAKASVMLQQPEVHHVFSQGSCPWITGPWQWWAALAPRRGDVDSDLCFQTGFLVAVKATLAFHARFWGLR